MAAQTIPFFLALNAAERAYMNSLVQHWRDSVSGIDVDENTRRVDRLLKLAEAAGIYGGEDSDRLFERAYPGGRSALLELVTGGRS